MKEQFLSQSNEWYTPEIYVNLARAVLGTIDLDPASCEKANQTVRAVRYFDGGADGLNQEWKAETVFCNPPYGKTGNHSNAGIFAAKMVEEYAKGNFRRGILLVNASTAMTWFKPLFQFPICFTDHRIRFISGVTGEPEPRPTKDNCFVYFHDFVKYDYFPEVFNQIGNTVKRI